MKIWKGNGNTAILLFYLKGLEILHQERRDQVNTIIIAGRFNSILFHKSGPPNKQHIYLSINQSINQYKLIASWQIIVYRYMETILHSTNEYLEVLSEK